MDLDRADPHLLKKINRTLNHHKKSKVEKEAEAMIEIKDEDLTLIKEIEALDVELDVIQTLFLNQQNFLSPTSTLH